MHFIGKYVAIFFKFIGLTYKVIKKWYSNILNQKLLEEIFTIR